MRGAKYFKNSNYYHYFIKCEVLFKQLNLDKHFCKKLKILSNLSESAGAHTLESWEHSTKGLNEFKNGKNALSRQVTAIQTIRPSKSSTSSILKDSRVASDLILQDTIWWKCWQSKRQNPLVQAQNEQKMAYATTSILQAYKATQRSFQPHHHYKYKDIDDKCLTLHSSTLAL